MIPILLLQRLFFHKGFHRHKRILLQLLLDLRALHLADAGKLYIHPLFSQPFDGASDSDLIFVLADETCTEHPPGLLRLSFHLYRVIEIEVLYAVWDHHRFILDLGSMLPWNISG